MNPTITFPLLTSFGLRTNERFAAKVPAVLQIPAAHGATYLVTVLDVSKTGLRVCCPTAISVGTRIEVKVLGATVKGTVRYVREVDHEFNAGIEADVVEKQVRGAQNGEIDLTSLFVDRRVGSPRRR
jgi:hypothetical protein